MTPLLLLASSAFATPDAASHIAQAKFFLRKGWTQDARLELEAAVAQPDGATDATAWSMLATVRYQLLDVPGAAAASLQAAEHAQEPGAQAQAAELARFLSTSFAPVALTAPREGLRARVPLTRTSLLLDADLAAYLQTVQEHGATPTLMPRTLWLPVGAYELAGAPIELAPCQELTTCSPVAVSLSASEVAGGPALVALHGTRFELSAGTLTWGGAELAEHTPGTRVELAVDRAIGPVWIGATAALGASGYRTPVGKAHVRGLDAVGARISATAYRYDPLQLDVFAGYRNRDVPGHALSCGAAPSLSCDTSSPGDTTLYTSDRAHAPWVGLSLSAGTPELPLRVGLSASVERAFGKLPDALILGSGYHLTRVPIVDPRSWSATGGAVSLTLSAAL